MWAKRIKIHLRRITANIHKPPYSYPPPAYATPAKSGINWCSFGTQNPSLKFSVGKTVKGHWVTDPPVPAFPGIMFIVPCVPLEPVLHI